MAVGAWAIWLLVAATAIQPVSSARSFLLLDLDGDGLYLGDSGYPVSFDVDGDGVLEETAWTASDKNEAFLWIDANGDGRVNDGGELIGSPAGGDPALHSASVGLVALDQPDAGGNGDGRLTTVDAGWRDLGLWIDRDHDGRSSPSELTSLEEAGVVAIRLIFTGTLWLDGSGNLIRGYCDFDAPGKGRFGRVLEVEFSAPAAR